MLRAPRYYAFHVVLAMLFFSLAAMPMAMLSACFRAATPLLPLSLFSAFRLPGASSHALLAMMPATLPEAVAAFHAAAATDAIRRSG